MATPTQRRSPGPGKLTRRMELIEEARETWVDRLIDTSRRNNLLFFRALVGGTIEIPKDNGDLIKLLQGTPVNATSLLPDTQDRPARILSIARKARENREEKGLQTLYLAFGFAEWKAEDGGRDYRAPVFLVPIELKQRGSEYSRVEVSLEGDPQVNPVLIHILYQRFGIHFIEEELLPATDHEDRNEARDTRLALYQQKLVFLQSRVHGVPEFRTDCAAVIGNFAFAKMAMVNDLRDSASMLSANDLIAAIAGDEDARSTMASRQTDIDPRSIDSRSPDDEFCVVDADSSQQCAIDCITCGQSAVVHGPPGTGKSQTITNLIATLIAKGKTVLFVAEKRAALEVVQHRLNACHLGHLAIDMHGAELSSRKVMEQVAETLSRVRHTMAPDCVSLHRKFSDRRSRLNLHDGRMHAMSSRTGMSLFEMQGKLLLMPPGSKSEVRWRGTELEKLTPTAQHEVHDALQEMTAFASLVTREDPSPWTGIAFDSGAEVQKAIDTARRLAFEILPVTRASLSDVCLKIGFEDPQSLALFEELVGFLWKVNGRLDVYTHDAYSIDLSPILSELERGTSALRALWLSLTSASYRTAFRKAVGLRKGVKASRPTTVCEVREIIKEAARWRESARGKTTPTKTDSIERIKQQLQETRGLVTYLQSITGKGWEDLTIDDLHIKIELLAQDPSTPYRLLKLTELESTVSALGAGRLLTEIRNQRPAPASWPERFNYAWMHSAIDEMAIRDPEVRGFAGSTHNGYVEEFKKLDSDRLKIAIDRVQRAHAARAVQAMNERPSEEALIRAEAAKSRRHKPLRLIFREAWRALTAVCPCWMASPLSVSQLIDRGSQFDYVIFDEASQILPEDAAPALMRGRQIVVAGDNQQLPPTSFFASGLEEGEEESSGADGFESLLDMMLPFAKSFHLNWHYRSRDEALIAFSNHHIYKDRLVTFPGPGGRPAIAHELVDHIPSADGQEESCSQEVKRVVELVIEHARKRPDRSLGVIAMGIKHAMRLQGALDQELKHHPELNDFFDPEHKERFFVKNLERVQGDERDSIILSVGYGKNRAGDLPLRFGPILAAGGRRRLNVAITRARETMTVVSSFSHGDIDATKVREGTGLEFLRNFLQYAASDGKLITLNEISGETMNEFETDVCVALEARGMKLVPQVGCSSFRIDFGVCHPDEPGRFVMAIECDGATYHSSATARDRDRLRQQMLENLGWTFHRIWSTDWFLRRNEEIERTWKAYRLALQKPVTARTSPTTEPPGEKKIIEKNLSLEQHRGKRQTPPIRKRGNIAEYSHEELSMLYAWVVSDGALRTHDEIADEMFEALPFSRRGARIDAALRQTIAICEQRRDSGK